MTFYQQRLTEFKPEYMRFARESIATGLGLGAGAAAAVNPDEARGAADYAEQVLDLMATGGGYRAIFESDPSNPATVPAELGGLLATTLCHGDFRAANIMFDGAAADRVAMIDFQLLREAPGEYDLAYLICQSMTPALRRAHEHELIEEYYGTMAAYGAFDRSRCAEPRPIPPSRARGGPQRRTSHPPALCSCRGFSPGICTAAAPLRQVLAGAVQI